MNNTKNRWVGFVRLLIVVYYVVLASAIVIETDARKMRPHLIGSKKKEYAHKYGHVWDMLSRNPHYFFLAAAPPFFYFGGRWIIRGFSSDRD